MNAGNSKVVYSTQFGRMCPGCGQPTAQCRCKQRQTLPVGDGAVRVRRETKGRGGKTVTAIYGLALEQPSLQELAKILKRRCGAGGTTKEGVIEIQGDHCENVLDELNRRGFKAKKSGG